MLMAIKQPITRKHVEHYDQKAITFFKRTYIPVARVALFIVFFWFGFIKLTGLSPASELAEALTAKTVGEEWFDLLFKLTAFLECLVGILFLIPKAVRIVVPLLFFHMAVVCAPLVLVPELTWQQPFVPTLEGQYIIKNVVIIALAFGIAAHTEPLARRRRS
jgi:uncharacterized membrane protein YkgB